MSSYGGDTAREVNAWLSEGPRPHTHTRLEHAEETLRAWGRRPGWGAGHRLGADRLGANCACARLWGDTSPHPPPASAQVGGGRAFPNARPASFLARPQRVAVATQRPLPACGDAACLVASADPAAAATVGAHGGFG